MDPCRDEFKRMEESLGSLQAYYHTKTGNALISYFLFLWYSIFSTFSVWQLQMKHIKHIKSNRNHVNIVYKTFKVLYQFCILYILYQLVLALSLRHTVIFHTATFLFQSPCLMKISIFNTPSAWFTEKLWSKIIISNARQWYCKFNSISMTSHLGHFLTRIQYHYWLICSYGYWKYLYLLCNQLQHMNIEHIYMYLHFILSC